MPRGSFPNLTERTCPICGNPFTPAGPRSLYDTSLCKTEAKRRAVAERQGRPIHPRPGVPTTRASHAGAARPRADSHGPDLYRQLVREGVTEVTTKQIRERLDVGETALHRHIREMRSLGLLEQVHAGRYRVSLPLTPEAARYAGLTS